jgi:hypothetical protein
MSDYRLQIGYEATLSDTLAIMTVEVESYGDADFLSDDLMATQPGVEYAEVQVNCPIHGWTRAPFSICMMCADEAGQDEYDDSLPF